MDSFTIRWMESMHTGDDFSFINQTLEAGLDEGPLILAPQKARRTPPSGMQQDYRALVFVNPDWLAAHLVEHQEELSHEFWLGICQDVPRERRETAESALWHFAKLLDDLSGRNRKRPRPAKAALSNENSRPLTYGSVTDPTISNFEAVLEQVGDGFDAVALAHKSLPARILISRA
ncbi:hypothetical protein GG804_29475 [Sphingomonas histidinilytica]|jgi:hypothetical protein|uniref:hypothetical protein n=1 Tax=Sphingomonadales TaxID=204457 RepID=UPI001ADAFF40|nr:MULTISPECIES: hypothetical protein [Sphingomonadaceae]MBO9380884.1 hypothetical protein [Rhizorhabdus histidinilytica]MDG2514517.1 hypothetical protein [Sphingobium yanoikuyae]